MADFSIQDLTSPHADPERKPRAASFRRPEAPTLRAPAIAHHTARQDLGPTSPIDIRRSAAFHPPEEIAARRDVAIAFKRSMEDDAALLIEERASASDALFASALASEALGDFEQSALTLSDIKRHARSLNDVQNRASRRLFRQLEDWGGVEDSLARRIQDTPAHLARHDALEHATLSWLQGAGCEKIALLCASIDLGADAFAIFWRTQLLVDSLLSTGDLHGAVETILDALRSEDVSFPDSVEVALQLVVATHANLEGDLETAHEIFNSMAHRGLLAPEMVDAWIFLLAERGALDVLASAPVQPGEGLMARLLRARMLLGADRVEDALAVLADLLESQRVDARALILHEEALERLLAVEQDATLRAPFEEQLVSVLNLRLDATPSDEECVSLLLRLGRLYEGMREGDAAAAEVYREALQLAPRDPAVLRALGRVYSRNQSWELLVGLYEHEINALGDEPGVWRRHFQVAALYEQRLGDDASALEHYAHVLADRPHFLPALKASARLMEKGEQWVALADLFLARVTSTTSARQRLYMLDKVAEIAEQHLGDDEVAIGAWREILLISPEHPNAYSSLGRLLARNKQWAALVSLNEQEMERIDDAEEVADLCLRNADILARKLEDFDRAERCYRRVLEIDPDFLPALEGLGRLLASQGRWDDLAGMTSGELARLDDPRERSRQLGALAEIAELQLGRDEDAIRLHEETLEDQPGEINAYFALCRLYRKLGRWESLSGLIASRLKLATQPAQIASLHASLAEIHEWHIGAPQVAFNHYRAALCVDPENAHWLKGLERLWSPVGEEPARLAQWLTEIARSAMLEGTIRDAYRKVICRLTERAAGMPEAALDLRRAGARDDVENGLMLRLADGLFGERESLALRRVHHPLHDWEVATSMPRHGLGMLPGVPVEQIFNSLPEPARDWFALELELGAVSRFGLEQQRDEVALGLEIGALVHVGARSCHTLAGPDTGLERIRLRALEARRFDEMEEYTDWTAREIKRSPRADLIARRHLELATLEVEDEARLAHLTDAAQVLFPELLEPEARDAAHILTLDGPVIDDLYDALYGEYAWPLLRRCLDAHVARERVSHIRRAYLLDMLSDMLERYLDEPEAAFVARNACFEITHEADHLIALVRLSEQLGKEHEALVYQDLYFVKLWDREDISPGRCVGAGLQLARMLRARGEEQDHLAAMELLEDLHARFEQTTEAVDVRLELARVHASHGDPYAAAELFRRTLTPERVTGRVEDWREFVRIYRDGVGDSAAAYNLQWTLVRFAPSCEADLMMLVDLAEEAGALDSCARELERLAQEVGSAGGRALSWQAAMIFDDHLGWFEDAAKIYRDLLAGHDGEEEEVRLMRRLAMCYSRLPGKQNLALEMFRGLVSRDPFDVATYRGMSSLFTDIHTFDRARVVSQVQRTLGDLVEVDQIRAKTVPSRPLEDADVLSVLLPEALDEDTLFALRAAMPLAQKVWSEVLPQRKALENDRRAARDLMPIADLFYVVADAFELGRLKVWFGDSHPSPVQVLADGQPLIWLNSETISAFDEAELRFMAGYTAALAWSELTPLLELDGRQVWHLLEGVHYRQMGKGFSERVDGMSQEMADQVGSPLHAVARRRVLQALEPIVDRMQSAHCEAWPRAIETFAHRVGLVLCGDIEAATRCILKLEGWRGDLQEPAGQKHLRRHDRLRELIAFTLSEDYLEVRHALGLAGRPSTLGF